MTTDPQNGLTDDELADADGEELPPREQMSLIDPGTGFRPIYPIDHNVPHVPNTQPMPSE